MPLDERPRERLLRHGPASLSDAELASVLLGAGSAGRSSLDIGRALLRDGLVSFARRRWHGARLEPGIGKAKAAAIAAALEIGRRVAAAGENDGDPVQRESLARRLIARYAHEVQEHLGAIYLDSRHRVIREREVFVGTLNTALVSTRDILRFALEDHAAAVVIFHNHPSGDPTASGEDVEFTRKLVDAGKLLGIDVVDHLIIGAGRFVSLQERGMF